MNSSTKYEIEHQSEAGLDIGILGVCTNKTANQFIGRGQDTTHTVILKQDTTHTVILKQTCKLMSFF